MERKKKICIICKEEKFLWSHRCCKQCWFLKFGKPLELSKKRIRKVSEKHQERLEKYKLLRDEWLLNNPYCAVCGKPADDIHHMKKRIGDNLYKHFLSVCRADHQKIEENPQWAYEMGYSIPILRPD